MDELDQTGGAVSRSTGFWIVLKAGMKSTKIPGTVAR